MSFCKLSNDYINEGFTLIENTFFNNYLSKADGIYVKVYLYGLYLANQQFSGNEIERMAFALTISEEKVTEAFRYWEDVGIVRLNKTLPFEVEYLSCKRPQTAATKRNVKKYSEFCDECQRLFSEDVIMPNNYDKIFEVVENYKMEINAMLMAIRYCIDLKKGKPNIPFVVAVATNWAKEGLTTLEKVEKHIENLENNNENIRQIFEALALKRSAELEDRQLYLKWTKEYNYSLDAILVACKLCKKKGGTEKLDKVIDELRLANAFSAVEIDKYAREKDETLQLAIDIIKGIGGFYSSLDVVVETYIVPWKNKGYDRDGLLLLAQLCFKSDIKVLSGLDNLVEKFYKLGIISKDNIENYIDGQILVEKKVKEVLECANSRNIATKKDREYYKTFVEEWGFSHEAVLCVSERLKDMPFPMSAISRDLSTLKQQNIFDVEGILRFLNTRKTDKRTQDEKNNFDKREYTKEEMNSVVIKLKDLNVEDIEL